MAQERLIQFRFRPDRKVPFADVRGEMRDFNLPIELSPASEGWYEAAFRLPTGTYGYKFRLPGDEWFLDPHNGRTRSWRGMQNSLLVVDGADEPILHAPAPPWVHIDDDGLFTLRAGLRHTSGDRLTLRWSEGQAWREVAMSPMVAEDEHLLFETYLPASAAVIEYLFALPDGRLVGAPGGPGQSFRVKRAELECWSSTPTWWKEAVLYTIFVDRFRQGGRDGRWSEDLPSELGEARAGGDILGVIEALPYLEELGATALHLTPICKAPSAHRYDTVDSRVVDTALGGDDALAALLEAAHNRGLKILLDLALTHVHMDFFAFQDVCRHGPDSPYWEWFLITRFPFTEGPLDTGYQHYQKGQWREPLLNLETQAVADYLVETFEHWTNLGVDGFRIDAAADVPFHLLDRVCRAVKTVNGDAVVFGEVIPEHLYRYLSQGLDAATDFAAQELLYDWLVRDKEQDMETVRAGMSRRRFLRGGAAYRAIGFTATHDQHRLLTVTDDSKKARLGMLHVLMRPEIPALYYGDEIGLRAPQADRQFEGAWSDRQPMIWDSARWDEKTLSLVKAAIAARKESRALACGGVQELRAERFDGSSSDETSALVFRRIAGHEVVDIMLHGGPGAIELTLAPDAPSHARVLVASGEVEVDSARGSVRLGPWSGVALARERSPDKASVFKELLAQNGKLAVAAYREGSTQVISLPKRLYLTVTEACNLRCVHCLTHAPRLTRERRARQMRPWVIDTLEEPMAAAEYFGFSHGGESLVSPYFFEILGAIKRARGRRPGRTDIHLLSNGILLTADKVQRIIDYGVTSLAVSLDGATPKTNDGLRVGAQLETIRGHLAEAVDIRERQNADLRVGISFVACQRNVGELPMLGQLVSDLGIDWLKVEEMHPSNAIAKGEMLRPGDPRLARGMKQLQDTLSRAGIVLVDHIAPPDGCWCQAPTSPRLKVFREADDFANRARFNPCRTAWEQACIDPDGTVHAVDYDHPALGNLLEASLFDLWNSKTAQRIRSEALARVPSQLRRACVDLIDGDIHDEQGTGSVE